MFCENALCFNYNQTKIKLPKLLLFVEKVSFQVKNEKETSLNPAFPLIFKDQYSEIFGQNIRIIFCIQNYHESNMNINIRRKIFEYLNIFEYSFEHWFTHNFGHTTIFHP